MNGAPPVDARREATPTPDELVRQHMPLVRHVVNQLAARYPRHVDRDELWSAGALGLVDAARRYNAGTGVPFARYASIRVRGAIIDANRDQDWAPRSVRRHARDVRSATEALQTQHGRAPSQAEIARSLQLNEQQLRVRQADLAQARVLELDRDSDDDEAGATLADAVCERHEDTLPEAALERRELLGALRMAVSLLPDGHRELIERYYFGEEFLRDIAADRGVSEARISQLCLEAVHALRSYFSTVFDGVPPVPERAPGRGRRERFVASLLETSWRERLTAAGA